MLALSTPATMRSLMPVRVKFTATPMALACLCGLSHEHHHWLNLDNYTNHNANKHNIRPNKQHNRDNHNQ